VAQQTLRATLDWSHGLLADAERVVFRRLAVFSESCSLDSIEAICADSDVSATDMLDFLSRLVDKSLVVADDRDGHARYRLLESVRQYAFERLVTSGERDLMRRRHALYYMAFAEARAQDATTLAGPGA
jgi:predicted ATPase